jgi:hypothetical protein
MFLVLAQRGALGEDRLRCDRASSHRQSRSRPSRLTMNCRVSTRGARCRERSGSKDPPLQISLPNRTTSDATSQSPAGDGMKRDPFRQGRNLRSRSDRDLRSASRPTRAGAKGSKNQPRRVREVKTEAYSGPCATWDQAQKRCGLLVGPSWWPTRFCSRPSRDGATI